MKYDDRAKVIKEISKTWKKLGEEDKELLEKMVKGFYSKP